MTKILVDVMPEKAKECPFAEYVGMTSKNSCRLKSGMYSRCKLECEQECDMLKEIGSCDDESNEVNKSNRCTYRDNIFDTKEEATRVHINLLGIAIKLGYASVLNYYEIIGVASDCITDSEYGWTIAEISMACVIDVKNGYKILLSYPHELKGE